MYKVLKKIVLAVSLVIVVLSVSAFGDASSVVEGYGMNTAAGNSTYLRSSEVMPGTEVYFDVKTPSGALISVSAVAGDTGIAQAEFSADYTGATGRYDIVARPSYESVGSVVNFFEVYSDGFVNGSAEISPANQVVNIDSEIASFEVALRDGFGNAVEGHVLKVISSSDADAIRSSYTVTDVNGVYKFDAKGSVAEAVTYSIYDVTADKVLDSKAKVVYFDNNSFVFENDYPSDFSYAAVGSGAFGADNFGFSDIPPSITSGQNFSVTLNVLDASAQKVVDYAGTVRFVVSGENGFYANLPDDYTYTVADLGSHTFSLAFSFLQEGVYKVEVRDVDNVAILGEYDFVVSAASAVAPAATGLNISNPISGTYSNPIQVISGTAGAGSRLKIYDNDLEISSLVADAGGKFSFTTGVLSEGDHKIYVALVNDVGTIVTVSSNINLLIDTASPDVEKISLEPGNSVDPSSVVKAKVHAEAGLSKVSLMVNDGVYDMAYNANGYYEVSFVAPVAFGDYVIDVTLTDELGNASKVDAVSVLTVGVVSTGGVILGDVTGLVIGSDDRRVTLDWVAPEASINGIKNYRVYYGLSPTGLSEAIDTFTNSPTWYIPNLKNGVEYFFAVVAVDTVGNVSEHFSNIGSATPNPLVVDVVDPAIENGSAGNEDLMAMDGDVSETGPELLWLVLFSLIGGWFYSRTKRSFALEVLEASDDVRSKIIDCLR